MRLLPGSKRTWNLMKGKNMPKSLADMPDIQASGEQFWLGFHHLQARMAQEHGPIFKAASYDQGMPVQDYVFMVGPEANRFVLHTHREHFSHDLGWTPIIGEDLGHGLLNMDGAEHTRHRKMWNPAFTNAIWKPIFRSSIV